MGTIGERLNELGRVYPQALAALQRLVVCRGGFTGTMAAALIADVATEGDVEGVLRHLRETGFIFEWSDLPNRAARYGFDPLVAEAVLNTFSEADRNAFFRALFDYVEAEARRQRDTGQYDAEQSDILNLTVAFEWAVARDSGAAFWLVGACADYLRLIGQGALALEWIDRVAEHIPTYHDAFTRGAVFNAQGVAHQTMAEEQEPVTHLRRAIGAYQQAVAHYPLERAPSSRAVALHNLGTAFNDLARLEARGENLRRAIDAYRRALAFRTLDRDPISYAATQLNMGQAYRGLAGVEPAHSDEHLRTALDAYREALRVYTPEEHPLDYAAVHNNIGNAYRDLASVEDSPIYLHQAIEAYQTALEYRTPDQVPHAYANTQNNLGAAYRSLADHGDSTHYLSRAVRAFEAALIYYALEQIAPDYAAANNNLGAAYHMLSTYQEHQANLQRASLAFRAALDIYLPERYPLHYATTQANLGLTLRARGDSAGAERCWREAHQHFHSVGDIAKAAMMWEWLIDLSGEPVP